MSVKLQGSHITHDVCRAKDQQKNIKALFLFFVFVDVGYYKVNNRLTGK